MKPSSHKPSRSVAREVRKILREHTVYARSDVAGRQFGRIAAELLEGFKLPVDADIEVGEFRVRRPSISDVFVVDRLGSHALQRYDEPDRVSTRRDPFEDLCAWTKGLRSHDYTGYLLRKYHSLRAAREIREAARAIGVHAEAAVDLIDQAKCGPPEISYLPYYYALLNLAKIYVVARGRGSALSTNKSHGAGYDRQANVQGALAAEWIEIRSKGSIPLFYEALTGLRNPVATWKHLLKIRMGDVYPRIRFISTEYKEAYPSSKYPFAHVDFSLQDQGGSSYRLRIEARKHPKNGAALYPERLQLLKKGKFRKRGRILEYLSPLEKGSAESALKETTTVVNRALLHSFWNPATRSLVVAAPLSRETRWLWPEELPILLAFFHLSNVVRYDPRYLDRLKDSREWAFLFALRDNAPFNFLELFWSFMKQRNVHVSRL